MIGAVVMLLWFLFAAFVLLPVALALFADDGPRRDELDPGSEDDEPERVAA